MYAYSADGEIYYGDYATPQKALEAACDAYPDADRLWVGRCQPPTPPELIWRAEDWLEQVTVHDDYCSEVASGWDNSTAEERAELEAMIRPILGLWLDSKGLRPSHMVVNEEVTQYVVERVVVDDGVTRKVRRLEPSPCSDF